MEGIDLLTFVSGSKRELMEEEGVWTEVGEAREEEELEGEDEKDRDDAGRSVVEGIFDDEMDEAGTGRT